MRRDSNKPSPKPPPGNSGAQPQRVRHDPQLEAHLKHHFLALNAVRRGVCLLNAGRYHEAEVAFSEASVHGHDPVPLATFLAACHTGLEHHGHAAQQYARAARHEPSNPAHHIRQALAQWTAGQQTQAVATLREAIARDPDCAELHFQLGTLLTELDQFEEAELRFTQAANLDRNHAQALVSLALCCGVRQAPGEALAHLQRAQARRPYDPRVGLLLAQAARAAREAGREVSVRAAMPGADALPDPHGLEELARIIGGDPDFVDAFISLPIDKVDQEVFAVLLRTLERVLERQPEQAELHFHCGQVLQRLGRAQDAIDANERAVSLNPRFTRALVALGKLYQGTDRTADAAVRLEQAVRAGAHYADVYYLLGNLYRDRGEPSRARQAYRRALSINGRYQAARAALEALPA